MSLSRRSFIDLGARCLAVAGALPRFVPVAAIACDRSSASSASSASSLPESYFARKGWEVEAPQRALPDWYEADRVQAHLEMPVRWVRRPEFEAATTELSNLGIHAYSRAFKWADEDVWWRSDRGAQPRNADVAASRRDDVVRTVLDDARQHDARIIAYYWHMTNAAEAQAHPEWICRDAAGEPIEHTRRGTHLDITSAYRDVVLGDLLDLAALGVGGIFFDERHLPDDGCRGTSLESEFNQLSGLSVESADENDPAYRQFLDFSALRVEETFAWWKAQVQERYPDVLFIVSTSSVPALINRRMTTDLARIADVAKNEFHMGLSDMFGLGTLRDHDDLAAPDDDVRMALGWTVLRDSAAGRPPRIGGAILQRPAHLAAAAAAVVTYGCVANLTLGNESISERQAQPARAERTGIRRAAEFGARVSPHLAGARPVRWGAIHFPELARNARGGDHAAAWREALAPMAGAFAAATRARLQAGIVTDRQLARGELDGFDWLFLPVPDELIPEQQEAIAAFEAVGGTVIRRDPELSWTRAADASASSAAFLARLEGLLPGAPARVTGGPDRLHAQVFAAPGAAKQMVALTNDFSFVQTHRGVGRRGEAIRQPPPAASGVVVESRPGFTVRRVHEAVADQDVPFAQRGDGVRIEVPAFETISLLVLS